MIRIICAGLVVLLTNNCLADQNIHHYSLNKQTKLSAVIAEAVSNRIEFGLLGFREIIGDESKYTFISDQNHKNIFLTPKVPAGNHIALSLINKAGEIVDLDLSVQKTDGQVIKIDRKISEQRLINQNHSKEITLIIKAMKRDIDSKGRYYVTNELRSLPCNIEGLSLTQDRTYKFEDLIGSRIIVTNHTKVLKEFNIYDFKNLFEKSSAISIQKKVLRPREKGFVYVVTTENLDD